MSEERQFRLFSIAVLGLVALVTLRVGTLRPAPEMPEPAQVQSFDFHADLELDAASEVESINAGEYNPYVIGQAENTL